MTPLIRRMKLEITRMFPRKREIHRIDRPKQCYIQYCKIDRGEEVFYYDKEEPTLVVRSEGHVVDTLHWGGKEEHVTFGGYDVIVIGDEVVFEVNGEEKKVKLDSESSIFQLCNQLELAIGLFEVESCT